MNERIKMFQAFFALVTSLFGFGARAQCPDSTLHETAQDCPWAQITRATDGLTDGAQIRAIITAQAPAFMAEMDHDGAAKSLLNLWGLSRNIDESNLTTGIKTVPVNLLQYFVSIWNVPYNSDFSVGHAGLNHTYGYLLSNLYTPYGFKRARYVQGEIEMGFGISDGMFSGMPSQGTLLSNLTYFAGTIAFRDSQNSKDDFKSAVNSGQIASIPELVHYDYSSLKVQRLVEVVANSQFYLELRTDIVTFPKANTRGTDTALLIYSLDFRAPGEESRPRLITAFPVQASFAAALFDSSRLGDSVPLKLNYNAALPVTVPAEQMVGKRFILNESSTSSN